MQALLGAEYPHFDVVWFGHIGDGNLHINILKPKDMSTPEFLAECKKVDKLMFGKSTTPIDEEALTQSQLAPLHDAITKIRQQLREAQFTPIDDILCTSAKTRSASGKEGRLGIDAVRWACLQAAGIEPGKQGRKATDEKDDFLDGLHILEDR